jgi:hypothetical protein
MNCYRSERESDVEPTGSPPRPLFPPGRSRLQATGSSTSLTLRDRYPPERPERTTTCLPSELRTRGPSTVREVHEALAKKEEAEARFAGDLMYRVFEGSVRNLVFSALTAQRVRVRSR